MRFNIRKKFIIVFLVMISPFAAITMIVAIYNQSILHKSIERVAAISLEMSAFEDLNVGMEKLLMPANDYIITGDKKYRDDFREESRDLHAKFEKARVIITRMEKAGFPNIAEERGIIDDAEAAVKDIDAMSMKIFSIKKPVGSTNATRLMEEMDYKLAQPAIERFKRWEAIDTKELNGAVTDVVRAWRRTSVIMSAAFAVMAAAGVYLVLLFSKLFVAPIKELRKGSEAVSGGNLEYRIDIRTGDELEQLGSAFNSMAGSLIRTLNSYKNLANRHGRLIDTAPDAIVLVDSRTKRIIDANPAGQALTGYSKDELLTLSMEALHPEEGLERYTNAFKRTVEEGRGTLFDGLVRRKDGSTVPVDIASTVVETEGGRIVQSYFRNITERKELMRLREEYTEELESRVAERTEALNRSVNELKDSRRAVLSLLEDVESGKKEWEDTFDSISDPIFIHDAGMKVIRCNRAYRECSGMRFKEIVGSPYYEVFPKMDGPFEMCRVVPEAEQNEFEAENIRVPEKEKVFRNRFFIIRDIYGGYHSTIHLFEDITEQEKAIKALRDAKERFETLFDNATDAVFIHDLEGRFVEVNRPACELLGYTKDEMLKMTPSDIDTPEYAAMAPDRMKTLKDEGHVFFKSAHRRRDGGVIPVEINSRIFDYEGSPAVLSIARDVSERRSAEEKIRQEMEITHHLLMIAEATSVTSDLNKLMEHAAGCVKKIMSCDITLFYDWDEESKVFRPGQSAGLSSVQSPFFMAETIATGTTLVSEALSGRRAVLKKCAFEGEKGQCPFASWIENCDTLAVIPLVGREDILGLLVCVYTGSNPKTAMGFTERDEKIMHGTARQVSIALEEAWLYRETMDKTIDLSKKMETIKTMHEIDKHILSTLDPQTMLETAVNMIAKVILCDRATIALVEKEKGGFIFAAGFGITFFEKGGIVPFEETSTTEVIRTGRPEYMSNLKTAGKLRTFEKGLTGEGFLSHIRIPILVKGAAVGVLTVGSKRPSAFSHEDLSTLENLGAQIGVALDNSRLIKDVEDMLLSVIKTLSNAIDAKSPWTKGHSERVTKYAVGIGKEMGFDEGELKNLEIAGLLHDIGKLGTYEYILDKPVRLTDDELKLIREHPGKGAEILEPIKQLAGIIPAVKYHHEYYDGSGYPEGLKGEDIPLVARILTVADATDAMGADRPYRKGRPMDAIVEELKRCSGTQFDPAVVDAFLKTLKESGVVDEIGG